MPCNYTHARLLVARVMVGSVSALAIIDTVGQATVGNVALREALRHRHEQVSVDMIAGVTEDVQEGEGLATPPIHLGSLELHMQHMSFADMKIFELWHLRDQPALLIGMDALGVLDTLIIDYRRHELQVQLHPT